MLSIKGKRPRALHLKSGSCSQIFKATKDCDARWKLLSRFNNLCVLIRILVVFVNALSVKLERYYIECPKPTCPPKPRYF